MEGGVGVYLQPCPLWLKLPFGLEIKDVSGILFPINAWIMVMSDVILYIGMYFRVSGKNREFCTDLSQLK